MEETVKKENGSAINVSVSPHIVSNPEDSFLPSLDLLQILGGGDSDKQKQAQITELIDSGRVVIPTSRTFWSQPDVALNAPNVTEVPADSKGTVVKSQITSTEGDPVKITYFDCQIEATVAQLIAENSAPIIITPAQIYRKYAQMDGRHDVVTKKQEQEVIESMDKLIKTPATLDFTMEIQNHTRLKKNPDYDYTNTVMQGTLITGIHISQKTETAKSLENAEKKFNQYFYKGKMPDHIFIIYSMPMYAIHDHMVNQIATFPSRLLNGGKSDASQDVLAEKREPTNESHIVAMKRYILVQVRRMRQNKTNERSIARYHSKKIDAEHTERLSFTKIAEHSDIILTPRSLRTLRTNTERILNALIREEEIMSYNIYKKGRAYDGVEITL